MFISELTIKLVEYLIFLLITCDDTANDTGNASTQISLYQGVAHLANKKY